jgi:trimeric autotransporter adhesin
MAGLLTGVLGAVMIAAGVLTSEVGVGAGLIAGGIVMLGQAAAQAGIIGGSAGKFLSGYGGTALALVASLGAAGIASFGASTLAAGQTAAASTISSSSAAGAAQATANAGVLADTGAQAGMQAVATDTSFLNTANVTQAVTQMGTDGAGANALGQLPSGLTAQQASAATAQAAGGTAVTSNLGASASQAANAATSQTAQAVTPTGGAAAGNTAGNITTSANAGTPQMVDTSVPNAGAGMQQSMEGAAGGNNPLGAYNSTPPPAAGSGGVGGMLSNAANWAGAHPGVLQAGGQMISGAMQGAAQEKMMQEQIAAQQWGNLQWQQPNQVANMQAAAARPITVPQGYLARAQQLRGLSTQGVQPLPAASPGAPLAPSPVAPV